MVFTQHAQVTGTYIFFKQRKAIEYLKLVRKNQRANARMFVCTYDIPRSILKQSKGKGFYDSGASGYDFCEVSLREYAVDVDDFWCSWLVNVERDKDSEQIASEEAAQQ